MPTFRYKALNMDGMRMEGTVVAVSRRDAIQRLTSTGQNVVDIKEQAGREASEAPLMRFRRSPVRLSTFTRQLATLSASGVPLVQGLSVLMEQTAEQRARQVLSSIRESVEGGSTLAEALEKHPETFPKIMASMVRVGEMGGTLDEVLTQMSELFEKEEAFKGEIRAAMAYPSLVLFMGLSSAIVLLTLFIPRLEQWFQGMGEQLPTITRVLLAISGLLTKRGWALAAVAVLAIAGLRVAMRDPRVRIGFDLLKLRIPWLGRLMRNAAMARLSRLLGTLLHGGISLVAGLDIVGPAVGNEAIADAVHQMSRRIRGGESLAALMKERSVFPPLLVQMVAVGEESGRLDQVLLRAAETYEREAAISTKVLTSLLAPAMILCVAGLVAFIVLSMMLPIFQLSSVVR